MKKFFILVISASVLLTGCVLPSFSKHRPRHSSESAPSSRRTKTSSSSSESSSSSSESTEIVSKTLVGDIEEIHHRDTITYQDKKILNLRMELLTSLPEEASAASATLTPEEMTTIIREGMQSDSNYVAAKSLEGVNIDYSVTAEKKLQTLIEIDLQKVNVEEVEKNSFFQGFGLKDIKDITPEMFILSLKLNGLKEEVQS
ncbi:hypothetical protein MK407_08680 [Streptococcus sanguinis]|uniref:SP0191 family lipoprotein n=1 Tax=Streptococcus sanguinis TaxID=1305 RepID=UPI0022842D7C|nr:SP0191 family lipoprotein [Streptococcus sanguinis]MCY7019455.1 hypothetical protein [Streptococcus sanguinis]MCY7039285.1 hypothetical protein [Streptococcus sanguinis]